MRRFLALLCATLGVVGLVAAPASAATAHRPTNGHLHTVSSSSTTLTLTWTNPNSSSFRSTIVRYAAGTKAPRTVSSGHLAGHPGAHTQTLHLSRLAAGHHYAFALFPVLTRHRYGTRTAVVGLVAPAPATGGLPFVASGGMRVTWTNPHTSTFRRVVVRYAAGSAAPSAPNRGHGVALSSSRPSSALVTHLLTNSHYSVSVFALDYRGGWSTPAVVRFTTPSAAEHAGTYSGTVTDNGGTPLVGAVVDASNPDRSGDHSTTTDAQGKFALPLPAGEYFVTIDGQHISGGNSTGGYVPDDEDVVVRAGHTTAAHIVLQGGGVITGRFTDSHGHPLAGVAPFVESVGSYVPSDGDGFGFAIFSASGSGQFGDVSSADGTFTVRGVPADGAVRLCADASGTVTGGSSDATGYSAPCATRTLVVGLGAGTAAPDLVLDAATGGTVTGTVTGGHVAIPGAVAYLVGGPPNSQDAYFDVTDAHGHFVIDDVPAGSYQLCAGTDYVSSRVPTGLQQACNPHPVTVATGTPALADVTLPLGAAVTGTVRGPGGHRVAGADVETDDGSGDDSGDGLDANTNSQGQYTLTGLAPGSYGLCVTPPSDPTSLLPTGVLPGCVNGDHPVHLTAGTERSGLDVTLPAGSALSGTVIDSSGHGTPAAVDVESVDDDNFDGADTLTDAHGHYTVAGLPADTYRVCFQDITASGDQFSQCAVHVVTTRIGRTSTHVDGQLPATSAISVTVTDGGAPVAGADVAALSPCAGDGCDTETVFSTKTTVAVDASTTTDTTGTALLDGIAPGTYAVCVFAYDATTAAGGSPTGYADTCSGTDFTIMVTRGSTATTSVALLPGGAVSGTVTDASNNPVAGAQALVSNSAATDFDDSNDFLGDGDAPSDDSPLSGGFSAADGTFTVIGVQPGAQKVCVAATGATGGSSPAGYLDQCPVAADGTTSGGTPVTVTAGQVASGVTISLSPAAGIAGTLRHGSTPIPLRQGEAVVFSGRAIHEDIAEVPTDSAGRYVAVGLTPGAYTVCFVAVRYGGQCYKNIAWDPDGAPPLDKATLVSAAAGSIVTGIDGDVR